MVSRYQTGRMYKSKDNESFIRSWTINSKSWTGRKLFIKEITDIHETTLKIAITLNNVFHRRKNAETILIDIKSTPTSYLTYSRKPIKIRFLKQKEWKKQAKTAQIEIFANIFLIGWTRYLSMHSCQRATK